MLRSQQMQSRFSRCESSKAIMDHSQLYLLFKPCELDNLDTFNTFLSNVDNSDYPGPAGLRTFTNLEKQDFPFNVIISSAERTTGLQLSVAHVVKRATLGSTVSYERTPSDRTSQQRNQQQLTENHTRGCDQRLRSCVFVSVSVLTYCNSGQL